MKVTGWMGKEMFEFMELGNKINTKGAFHIPEIFANRGKEEEWIDSDWPPVKVTATIEKAE